MLFAFIIFSTVQYRAAVCVHARSKANSGYIVRFTETVVDYKYFKATSILIAISNINRDYPNKNTYSTASGVAVHGFLTNRSIYINGRWSIKYADYRFNLARLQLEGRAYIVFKFCARILVQRLSPCKVQIQGSVPFDCERVSRKQ